MSEQIREFPSEMAFVLMCSAAAAIGIAGVLLRPFGGFRRDWPKMQSCAFTAMLVPFFGLSILTFCAAFASGSKQASIAISNRKDIAEFATESVRVMINGVDSARPGEIQEILQSFDEVRNRKSHQTAVFSISISDDRKSIDFELGKDSRVSDEFWLSRRRGDSLTRIGTVHSPRLTELIDEAVRMKKTK